MFDKMLMRTKAFIRTSEAGQGDTELRKKRDQSAPLSRQRRSFEQTNTCREFKRLSGDGRGEGGKKKTTIKERC